MRRPEKLRSTEAHHAPVPLAECALARAIAVIGDAWSLLILREAVYRVMRFSEMQADLAIPRAVLSNRLAKLVEAGLFEQVAYREAGRRERQEYVLTERGHALMPALVALREWASDHLPGQPSPLRLRHAGCGAEVHTRLVCDHGHVLGGGADVETAVERGT